MNIEKLAERVEVEELIECADAAALAATGEEVKRLEGEVEEGKKREAHLRLKVKEFQSEATDLKAKVSQLIQQLEDASATVNHRTELSLEQQKALEGRILELEQECKGKHEAGTLAKIALNSARTEAQRLREERDSARASEKQVREAN